VSTNRRGIRESTHSGVIAYAIGKEATAAAATAARRVFVFIVAGLDAKDVGQQVKTAGEGDQ
jgi:hypothetical protein